MTLKSITAADVMRKAVSVDPERTVAHGKLIMERNSTDFLYVSKNGNLSGIFYKSDISDGNLKGIIADFTEPCKLSVLSDSDLAYVLQLLKNENLYALPVVEKGKCTGIITRETLRADGFIQ